MIKIKAKPEDFMVEEIAALPLQKDGDFCVYLLEKRGWNTVDILKMLSKKFTVPYSSLSYGGKKDKYALTSQYITIARQGSKETAPPVSLPWQGGDFAVHAQPNDEGGIKKSRIRSINPPLITGDNTTPSDSMARHDCPVPSKIDEENYSLCFLGAMDRPMGPDLITGNRFHLVVRNLTENEVAAALRQIECVKRDGYPNYFDDQRFGSFDARQGFVAEKILKKHYNGALKLYFSRIHPEDRKEEKEHRKFFRENWGNWQTCLKGARSRFEQESFRYLQKDPKGFIPILQRISHEEMVLFFSAYQSHLWNEVLRKIMRSVVHHDARYGNFQDNSSPFPPPEGENNYPPLMAKGGGFHENDQAVGEKSSSPSLWPSHQGRDSSPMRSRQIQPDLKVSKGLAGDYLFYTQLDDKNKAYFSRLVIPMPASNIRMPDAFTEHLYAEVLKENNLRSPMFNIRRLRQAFFKGIERRAIVTPEDLLVDTANDEIYPGRKKLILKFFLPRGCYGTMFIKRLFC